MSEIEELEQYNESLREKLRKVKRDNASLRGILNQIATAPTDKDRTAEFQLLARMILDSTDDNYGDSEWKS